jgi:hypothetical protein
MARRRAGPVGPPPAAANAAAVVEGNLNQVHRVEFDVPLQDYETYEEMRLQAGAQTIPEMIVEALRVVRVLQEQAAAGYTDIAVKNPRTLEKRVLLIDFLSSKSSPR